MTLLPCRRKFNEPFFLAAMQVWRGLWQFWPSQTSKPVLNHLSLRTSTWSTAAIICIQNWNFTQPDLIWPIFTLRFSKPGDTLPRWFKGFCFRSLTSALHCSFSTSIQSNGKPSPLPYGNFNLHWVVLKLLTTKLIWMPGEELKFLLLSIGWW